MQTIEIKGNLLFSSFVAQMLLDFSRGLGNGESGHVSPVIYEAYLFTNCIGEKKCLVQNLNWQPSPPEL
jgi:hypothetical protein